MSTVSNEKSFALLIDSFIPFLHSRAASLSANGLEPEDLVQEGLMGLLAAVNSFDSSRGIAFNTFAHTCINNSMLSAVRAAARLKHRPLNTAMPLDSAPPVVSAEEQAISNEAFCSLKHSINSTLSDFEKKVLACRIDGGSNAEIAVTLGVAVKSVSNALERARRKLKEYMPK